MDRSIPHQFRTLTLFLLIPLAGCGIGSEEDRKTLSMLPSTLKNAKDCMFVHTAMLQAAFPPLVLSEDPTDAKGTLQDMRELADGLPLNDAGQPALRDAFRSMTDQVAGVQGKGHAAAGALVASDAYRRPAGVLKTWYVAHCKKDEKAPAAKE